MKINFNIPEKNEIQKITNHYMRGLHIFSTRLTPASALYNEMNFIAKSYFHSIKKTINSLAPIDSIFWKVSKATSKYSQAFHYYQSAHRHIIEVNSLTQKSIRIMNFLTANKEFDLALMLTRWADSFHPQVGASVALEFSGMSRLLGVPQYGREAVAIFFDPLTRSAISGTLQKLLIDEQKMLTSGTSMICQDANPPWIVDRFTLESAHQIHSISQGYSSEIFLGGITDDYSHGGISTYDVFTNQASLFLNDIAVFSLKACKLTQRLYVLAWKSLDCVNPQLAMLSSSGNIEKIVDLKNLTGKDIIPGRLLVTEKHLYILDLNHRDVYEIEKNNFRISHIFESQLFGQAHNIIDNENVIFVFCKNQNGFYKIDKKTKKFFFEPTTNNESLFSFFKDKTTNNCIQISHNLVFKGCGLTIPGWIITISLCDEKENVIFRQHFNAEYRIIDMTLWCHGGERRLLIPSTDHLISLKLR